MEYCSYYTRWGIRMARIQHLIIWTRVLIGRDGHSEWLNASDRLKILLFRQGLQLGVIGTLDVYMQSDR